MVLSEVVQFREDDEKVARLRSLGINPNEFGRAAFQRAYTRLLAEQAAARLEAASRRGKKTPIDVARLAREARDELAGRRD